MNRENLPNEREVNYDPLLFPYTSRQECLGNIKRREYNFRVRNIQGVMGTNIQHITFGWGLLSLLSHLPEMILFKIDFILFM